MSNENTTTRLTDTTTRLRYSVRADGTMVMPFVAESGNEYELSAEEVNVNHLGRCVIPTGGIFALNVECSCKGFQTHGHCYHTVQLRHRLAGEDVPSRDEVRAARRTARKLSARPRRVSARRVSAVPAIVEPVMETAPAPKKRRPSARRIH